MDSYIISLHLINIILGSQYIHRDRIMMQKISNSEFYSYRALIQKMKYYMFSRENFSFLSFVYAKDFFVSDAFKLPF